MTRNQASTNAQTENVGSPDLNAEIERLNLEIEKSMGIKTELERINEKSKREIDRMTQQIEILESQIKTSASVHASPSGINPDTTSLRLQISKLESELVQYEEENDNQTRINIQLSNTLKEAQLKLTKKESEIKNLQEN